MRSEATNHRLAGGRGIAVSLAASLFASAAGAVTVDVFWDAAAVGGFPAGFGISESRAMDAIERGIDEIQVPSVGLNPLAVEHTLDLASVSIPTPVGSGPATATSHWTATNTTDANNGEGPPELLYLIFARPGDNEILLNGQPHTIDYDPSDVGLTLREAEGGLDWVILRVPFGDSELFYPAVELGELKRSESLEFPLFYTLDNPQVFTEPFNHELGIPQWNLFFVSTVVPEPSTAALLLLGLGAIAVARPARP